MSVAPGDKLAHYRLAEKLGEGGMGEVWIAEDTRLNRQVALKVLPAEMTGDAERRARFEREAQTVAGLNHPNIVTLHSVEEFEGTHFITMELIRGRTLTELLAGGPLRPDRLLELAIALADAVGAAHQQGVTHRDLKPDNIMIAADGRLKVLDFGLAKLAAAAVAADDTQLATMTQEGKIVGTVAYMSPEQAEGKAIDARSDVFSLGIVLFQMATGRRPFEGDTTLSTLSSILRESPPSVTELNRSIPRPLGRIIQRCLAKDPVERFQSATGLHAELQALKREVDSGQLDASGEGSAAPRRSRVVPIALGAIALLIVVAALFWPRGAREATPPTAVETVKRVVVLPFENLGPAEDAYFADGVAEEITSRLGAVEGIAVISRSSSRQYAGTDKTIQQVGQELGVEYVLEGSVRWARQPGGTSRVKITPQLVRVADDTQIWSEPFDRVIEDIFEVQAEIAGQVVSHLGVTLVEGGRRVVEAQPTDNIDAYQLYLRGKSRVDSPDNNERNLRGAIELLEQAVELEPDFALAHAELGRTRAFVHHLGFDPDGTEVKRARESLDRALEIAPDSPRVHRALGYYHYWGEKEYDRAIAELSIAEQGLGNDGDLRYAKGLVLRRAGKWEPALREIRAGYELNPRDPNVALGVGDTEFITGGYRAAIEAYRESIALQPDQSWSYMGSAWASQCLLDVARAREFLEAMPQRDPMEPWCWFGQHVLEQSYADGIERLEASDVEITGGAFVFYPLSLMKAELWRMQGDTGRAAAEYETARATLALEAERRPADPRVHSALGLALSGLGRDEEAIAAGRRGLDLLPLDRDAIFGQDGLEHLALIYVRTGKIEDALDLLESNAAEHLISLLVCPRPLALDPRWAPLVEHPRFRRLVREAGGSE